MSLPDCQERILQGMASSLSKCEPRLASKFAIFTRLTRDEGIPCTEQLAPRPLLSWRRLHRAIGADCVSRRRRRAGGAPAGEATGRPAPVSGAAARMAAFVLVPIMLLIVVSVFVAAGLSGSRSCGRLPIRMAAAAQTEGRNCTASGTVNQVQPKG
jgi:hypothetical protein